MKSKIRKLAALFAVVMCMTTFSVTAFASDGGGCYASDENGTAKPSGPITNITVSTEGVAVPEKQESKPLTPPGNLTLVDDILQNDAYVSEESTVGNKQFLTVQSKNGNTFYLVIDRAGDTENVYFLNLVDEADLMALMEEGGTVKPVCSCKEKCTPGHVNDSCPVCKQNPSECTGKEAPVEETKPAEPPAEQQVTPEPENSSNKSTAMIALVLILALAGGGAFYWFKLRKGKPDTKGSSDLDDYDYGEDEDEPDNEDYEFENEDEEKE